MSTFTQAMRAIALAVMAQTAHADAGPTAELGALVQRMYTYTVHEFEFGRNPATGRYDARRNCALLRTFFAPPMLGQTHGPDRCEFEHSRFPPDAAGTPVEQLVSEYDDKPPVPFIQTIRVSGDQAQVELLFGAADAPKGQRPDARRNQGRVVFFCQRGPQGWRIVNKLSFRTWPLVLKDEGADCRYASLAVGFALAPRTPAELAPLPPACRALFSPPASF